MIPEEVSAGQAHSGHLPFISYAREDRAVAERLAAVFEARGVSVWWDREVVPGELFDQVIERELESARKVVVLWSARSVASQWVRSEATAAADRGVLVPAIIERGVRIPLRFRRAQTADPSDWEDDCKYQSIRDLLTAVTQGQTAAHRRFSSWADPPQR